MKTEKERKRKRQWRHEQPLYLDHYKELFENAWCPLFGKLPLGFTTPDEKECIGLIYQARKLWELPAGDPRTETSYPDIEEISDYPKDLVKSAREIFTKKSSIEDHVLDQRKKLFWMPWESNIPTIFEEWEDAVNFVRNVAHHAPIKSEKMPDYAILAIFAIREAWDVFQSIAEDENATTEDILRNIKVARDLFEKAKELKGDEEIKTRELEADEAWTWAEKLENEIGELKNKPRVFGKKGGEAKKGSPLYKEGRSELVKRKEKTWENNPTLCNSMMGTARQIRKGIISDMEKCKKRMEAMTLDAISKSLEPDEIDRLITKDKEQYEFLKRLPKSPDRISKIISSK